VPWRRAGKERHVMQTIRMLAAVLCLLTLAMAAEAKPEFLDVLTSTYKPYSQALAARGCANCHVSNSDLGMNPFGKQVKQALHASGGLKLTAAILKSVEGQASNPGDISNIDKIQQGLAPGAPKPAPPGSKPAVSETKSEIKIPFVPSNGFHPAIVHFPIALFLAGIFLDFLGLVRNNKSLLLAGWYNLVMAAVTALGGVTSGLFAFWIMKMPLDSVKTHLILAAVGTVIMWILVGLRAGKHENMSKSLRAIYIVVALIGAGIIAYAGHIGGILAGTA
jgi:uncharacterized membrane protein